MFFAVVTHVTHTRGDAGWAVFYRFRQTLHLDDSASIIRSSLLSSPPHPSLLQRQGRPIRRERFRQQRVARRDSCCVHRRAPRTWATCDPLLPRRSIFGVATLLRSRREPKNALPARRQSNLSGLALRDLCPVFLGGFVGRVGAGFWGVPGDGQVDGCPVGADHHFASSACPVSPAVPS